MNPTPQTTNNVATYIGGLIAGGIFWFLGTKGIFAPAGSEAAAAGVFAGLVGHVTGKLLPKVNP